MNFQWLAGVSPMVGVWILIGVYAVLLVWILTRKKARVLEGAPDTKRWRDLRIWIVPLLLLQVLLHLVFR